MLSLLCKLFPLCYIRVRKRQKTFNLSVKERILKSVIIRGCNDELSRSLSLLFCLCAVAGSPAVTEEALDGMLHLPEVVQQQIQLSTNPAENQLLRSEFYYEQVWI